MQYDPAAGAKPVPTNDDAGLSIFALIGIGILFLLLPGINVWVSSILFKVWRTSHPRRARQVNLLGYLTVAMQFVFFCWLLSK